MRVLVIGGGAREHALCRALLARPRRHRGRRRARQRRHGRRGRRRSRSTSTDPAAVAALAADLGVDLVVVGPEAPLVAGVADAVRAAGHRAASARRPRRPGSRGPRPSPRRSWRRPGCRPPGRASARRAERSTAALDAFGAPYVVKDDGLAAGKGVVVTDDRAAAHAARRCLRAASSCEEFLDGPEVSLFAVTDGTTVVPLQPAQDFKRVGDGDAGPEHRRHGRVLAAAVGAGRAGRRGPGDGRCSRPSTRWRRARHAVRRPALRRARADVARAAGHRVQRALRRPRDPGRARPAAHAAGRRCCTPPRPARSTRSAAAGVVATTPP